MKLRTKTITIIGLTFAGLLASILITPFHLNALYLTAAIILTALITYGLIYYFIISRIEKLNSLEETTTLSGHDEATHIQHIIQTLKKDVKGLLEQQEQHIDERTKNLQQINFRLHEEIAELTAQKEEEKTEDFTAQTDRHDKITGLPNRLFFNDILSKSINSARRRQQLLAVLNINLNSFKEVNNLVGINKGNTVLQEVGQRFTNALRSEDILAKLNGDEFIVLLTDISQAKFAGTVAEKLLRVCHQPIKIGDHELQLTASIGISIFPDDGNSLEDLHKAADTALYQAKHAEKTGNGNYQFFAKEIDIKAREYTSLEKALRRALENNELTLYYQPKFSIKRGLIAGVETLVRWEHPELGLIPPAKFIPIAEECGLILPIGEWILREACAMNKYWQDAGFEHFTIAVNLSAKQFHHAGIAEIVSKILQETRLNGKYLELEITEQTAMTDITVTSKVFSALKATGAQLSLDHFGMGYTSIAHLKQLPINAVKIDYNFIKGIPNNPNDSDITNAFIGLGHHLGLEVVAEGVETPEQMQFLSAHDCDIVQGYYLSHPMPAQKVELQFRKLNEKTLL